MNWFLYDTDLRYEKVKVAHEKNDCFKTLWKRSHNVCLQTLKRVINITKF